MQRRVRVRKKRRLRRLRIFLFTILLFLLAAIGYGAYVVNQTMQAANDSYDNLGREKSDFREESVSVGQDPISILLMGLEDYSSENGGDGRTDTLMVATFNPKDEKLKLLSIPRDTLVPIVGRGTEDKINHAHVFGGKRMTIDTVESFLEIPIDYYAAVNFDAFKNIVDILGGITVNVPFDFEQNSDDRVAEKLQFYEGRMDLDGRHALAFARMRYQDPRGDIGRNERQQEVIEAMIKKSLSFGTLTKVDDLVKEVGSNVETDLRIADGLAFVRKFSGFNTTNIDRISIETTTTRLNGISYEIADEDSLKEVRRELQTHLEYRPQLDFTASYE